MTAIPFSVSSAPSCPGILLSLDGLLGLAGWQWLFIIEAVPALILGVIVLLHLTDCPAGAKWLEPEQRAMAGRPAGDGADAQ